MISIPLVFLEKETVSTTAGADRSAAPQSGHRPDGSVCFLTRVVGMDKSLFERCFVCFSRHMLGWFRFGALTIRLVWLGVDFFFFFPSANNDYEKKLEPKTDQKMSFCLVRDNRLVNWWLSHGHSEALKLTAAQRRECRFSGRNFLRRTGRLQNPYRILKWSGSCFL